MEASIDPRRAPGATEQLSSEELEDAWEVLDADERLQGFRMLPRTVAEDFFLGLSSHDQARLFLTLPQEEHRSWLRLLAPDDAVDLIQELEAPDRTYTLGLLDGTTRREVVGLLAYAEDDAGGLMNPRYARVRPEMSVDEAISYLRRQTRERVESIFYTYVIDGNQKLLGVVSFRDLFSARASQRVEEIMQTDLVTVPEEMDQESVGQVFAEHDLVALPVVDAAGCMKGIVTVDDIVDVVQEEATEDIQKIGGSAALDAPYLQTSVGEMIRKRGVWLSALLVGEMLTATAMSYYEHEIARAVVLMLFVPLIISSGGNSGSQATTLVIRAMALGEVRLRDWWRVVKREVFTGMGLGLILAAIGFVRVLLWGAFLDSYGPHYVLLALTVSGSLVGVVLFGTICGSMLPFLLRAMGLDPASASAPFVATLVDVSGLVIYFTLASLLLSGTLL